MIKFKWAALPPEQREGIKNYASNLIIKYSTNEQLYRSESTFISKLNLILVQILKQVGKLWPPGAAVLSAATAALVQRCAQAPAAQQGSSIISRAE